MILVRYGELFLKSEFVKHKWEQILCGNIRELLPGAKVAARRGMVLVDAPLDKAKPALERVFGITSFADAVECEKDIDSMKKAALPMLGKGSFAVRANRADKRFPMTSQEMGKEVGAFLVKESEQKVNLTNPDSEVFIDVSESGVLVYGGKHPGPGGLPLGTSERLLLVNHSEEDVLAGWMAMKRGCPLDVAGRPSKELEAWSAGHPVHYVDSADPGDYLAVVSGNTELEHLRHGTTFYPLIALPERILSEVRRKVLPAH
jgi:thiamine biosynthesis protein ThiI